MGMEAKGARWTESIVLGGIDVGETDRIVHLLTEEVGRLSGVAKAARASLRRFGGALEPFSTVSVRYRERRGTPLAFLYEAEVRTARLGIRRDLWRIAVATYVAELVRELGREREANSDLYRAAGWALDRCATADVRGDLIVAAELRALGAAGLSPVVDACVGCGIVDVVGFDPSRAGVVCERCETPAVHRLAPGSVRSLAAIAAEEASVVLARAAYRPVTNAIGAFVEYQLARRMKARAFAVAELELACWK
ncbi:MAG: DNA repair protein RecO [Deltaproteobacteria bacterium]|nr:DNA repair protein RecO [Deltaproteobacteria bacterium]